jgi:hypothetical protein
LWTLICTETDWPHDWRAFSEPLNGKGRHLKEEKATKKTKVQIHPCVMAVQCTDSAVHFVQAKQQNHNESVYSIICYFYNNGSDGIIKIHPDTFANQ